MKGPILIIDDDPDIRDSVGDVLGDEGYKVVFATNGLEGIDYLKSTTSLPCLVLLDLMMPVMDGRGFREQQLKNPDLARIPTVLFSADGQLDKKAMNIGLSEYVKKPINLDQLLSIAKRFC